MRMDGTKEGTSGGNTLSSCGTAPLKPKEGLKWGTWQPSGCPILGRFARVGTMRLAAPVLTLEKISSHEQRRARPCKRTQERGTHSPGARKEKQRQRAGYPSGSVEMKAWRRRSEPSALTVVVPPSRTAREGGHPRLPYCSQENAVNFTVPKIGPTRPGVECRSNANGRRDGGNERREHSVQLWATPLKPKAGLNGAPACNYPTQAKSRLEWGTCF